MIKVENITKSFGDLQVLKGINLEVPAGKLYSIVGPSGAGKTTLLQIIGTLSKPNTGNVFINGQNISQMGETQLADFRNKQIGFVFQFHYLLPEFSAFENVCIPAYIAKTSKKEAEQKAREYLEFLGLSHRLNHKPAELSGGERQRVAIARALINNPSVILADEPSGNLDTKNREDLHQLFFTLRDKFKQTLVIVTHDESFASQSDSIIRMRDGLIEK
ncbi:MAG TPA: ABC transporter ATP-binding protein [Prolixibacteraceae bacterium]|nr:ABC transporter ATP-binding protein [Prolixibacteraceae bacterium]HPR84756.1 ABC transporter ATP-binding protein [Prolixibacteraceae bacterium]